MSTRSQTTLRPTLVAPASLRGALDRFGYLLFPLLVPLLTFLPRIAHGGFTGDDWSNRAIAGNTPASTYLDTIWDAPISHRALHPFYVNLYDTAFGDHHRLYLLWAVATGCVLGTLVAVLLARVGVPRWAAAAVGTLGVIFPYSSMTKIWFTAHIGHVSTIFAVVGLLVALRGLGRSTLWAQVAHHSIALVLFLLSLDLYEIALPLILLSGAFYATATWRATADPAARVSLRTYRWVGVRWALDVVLVLLWYISIKSHTVIGEDTTTSTFDRLRMIGGDGAKTLLGAFVPFLAQEHQPNGAPIYSGAWFGLTAALIVLAALVAFGVLAVMGTRWAPESLAARAGLGRWGAGLLIAIAAAFLGWLAIVPANDYYRPVPFDSPALRVNVLAAFGLAAVVVTVVGALAGLAGTYLADRRPARRPGGVPAGTILGAVLLLAVGLVYTRHIRSEIRVWNQASTQQIHVLGAVQTALGPHPAHGTVVVLTDQPEYIADGAEVFYTSWSFNGALESQYHDPTLVGVQHRTVAQYRCAPQGLIPYYVQYRVGQDAPIPYSKAVLVSTATARARRMSDPASCRAALRAAGLTPVPAKSAPATGTT